MGTSIAGRLQASAAPSCCVTLLHVHGLARTGASLGRAGTMPGQFIPQGSCVSLLQKAINTLMFLAEESDLNREAIAKAGAADAIAETVDYFAARKAQLCMQYGHIAPTAEAALAKLQDLSELMASCEVLD